MVKTKPKAPTTTQKDWNSLYSYLSKARSSFQAPVDTRISQVSTRLDSEDYHFEVLIKMIIGAQMKEQLSARKLEELKKTGLSINKFLSLSEEDLADELLGISYNKKKAKYIQGTCKILKEKYDEKVPLDYNKLISLPGIGPRSANMLLTILGKKPDHMITDANIHRICNRLGIISCSNQTQSEKELSKIIPKDLTAKSYVTLLGFAQVYCLPSQPLCKSCPASVVCKKVGLNAEKKSISD